MRERDHSDSASTYELLRSIAESQVEKELAQERAKSRKRARRKRRQSTKRRKRTKRTPFDPLLAAGIGNSRFSPNWPSEFRGLWPRGIRIARQLGRFGSNGLSTRPASPQFGQHRHQLRFPYRQPLGRRPIFGLFFCGKRRTHQPHCFARDLRRRSLHFHELASRLRPTTGAGAGVAGYIVRANNLLRLS